MKLMPWWAWMLIGLAVIGGGGYVGVTQLTRGYRNKNPGNIRYSQYNKWQGQTGQDDKGFVIFETDFYGLRALARLLLNYEKNGAYTVRQIITKYAPATENDTNAYVMSVSNALDVAPDAALMVATRLPDLMAAIVKHENGINKYSSNELLQAARAA